MDIDLSFPTLYKKIEEMYLADEEFTPEIVYTLTENIYRQELLAFFKLDEFKENINESVLTLYERIKDNKYIKILVSKLKEKYNDEMISFMTLFSYDYFYLFYPIIQNLNNLQNEDIQGIMEIIQLA